MSAEKVPSQKALKAGKKGAETRDHAEKRIASLIAQQAREALTVIFTIRFANAFTVRTFFQPDEYFQVLEPAWQWIYGSDSGAWRTWVRIYLLLTTRFSDNYIIVEPWLTSLIGMAVRTTLIYTSYNLCYWLLYCGKFLRRTCNANSKGEVACIDAKGFAGRFRRLE